MGIKPVTGKTPDSYSLVHVPKNKKAKLTGRALLSATGIDPEQGTRVWPAWWSRRHGMLVLAADEEEAERPYAFVRIERKNVRRTTRSSVSLTPGGCLYFGAGAAREIGAGRSYFVEVFHDADQAQVVALRFVSAPTEHSYAVVSRPNGAFSVHSIGFLDARGGPGSPIHRRPVWDPESRTVTINLNEEHSFGDDASAGFDQGIRWVRYERKGRWIGVEPACTINRDGEVALNRSAIELLPQSSEPLSLLLVLEGDVMEWRVVSSDTPGANLLRVRRAGDAKLSAGPALRRTGYDLGATRRHPVEWDAGQQSFRINLHEEIEPRHRRVGSRRKA